MPSFSRHFFYIRMNNICFSNFGKASLVPSPINQMTAAFSKDFRQGIDINLGVGYVNDETIPHKELQECFQFVLQHPETYKNALNYGSADGSENLRRAIKEYYSRNRIGGLTADVLSKKKICIGANGATSLLDSIAEIMPKGIVITTDPNYYIYIETLQRKGFTICAIPEDSDGMRVDVLEEQLKTIDTESISFFYIVTINNPSSVVMANHRKKQIVQIATNLSRKLNKKIPLIFDKAYEDILFDTSVDSPISAMQYDEDGLVVELGTLSKIIAPALRIGYAISDNSDIMNVLIQKTSDIGFSAPLINEEMASRFLDVYIDEHARRVRLGYKQKADFLRESLNNELGQYLQAYSGGQAGFYFYLTFKNVETHSQSAFFKYLSRTTGDARIDGTPKNPRLVYVPGEFCVVRNGLSYRLGLRQLRISYGFEDLSVLEKSVKLMREATEYSLSLQ